MDVTIDRKPNGHARSNGAARSEISLHELVAMDGGALAALYRNATTPRLHDLDGTFRGKMLAIPGLPLVVSRAAELAWHAIWRGKAFRSHGQTGEGVNLLAGGRVKALHYATSVGQSRAGAFDAIHLDYDLPKNLRPVRWIKDELRQLSPRLFLGQMYVFVGQSPRLGAWFALERD